MLRGCERQGAREHAGGEPGRFSRRSRADDGGGEAWGSLAGWGGKNVAGLISLELWSSPSISPQPGSLSCPTTPPYASSCKVPLCPEQMPALEFLQAAMSASSLPVPEKPGRQRPHPARGVGMAWGDGQQPRGGHRSALASLTPWQRGLCWSCFTEGETKAQSRGVSREICSILVPLTNLFSAQGAAAPSYGHMLCAYHCPAFSMGPCWPPGQAPGGACFGDRGVRLAGGALRCTAQGAARGLCFTRELESVA